MAAKLARKKATTNLIDNLLPKVVFKETPCSSQQCLLCHGILKNPLQLSCGHRVCHLCYERYEGDHEHKRYCPEDGELIENVFPDLSASMEIMNLTCYCMSKAGGCEWEGLLSDLEDHLCICQFKLDRPHSDVQFAETNRENIALHSKLDETSELLKSSDLTIDKLNQQIKEIEDLGESTKLKEVLKKLEAQMDYVNDLIDKSDKNKEKAISESKPSLVDEVTHVAELNKHLETHLTVSVLHCGGNEEVGFINNLEQTLSSYPGGPLFNLEYTEFQKDQTKEVVMFEDAKRYKKKKAPLLVLISKEFFNLVWPTPYKNGILNAITNHSSINCLHVWMGITEEDAIRRSTRLLRADGYFRRKDALELTSQGMMVNQIYALLSADGQQFNALTNYDVDDEVDEVRNTSQQASSFLDIEPLPPDTSNGVKAVQSPAKGEDLDENSNPMTQKGPGEIEATNIESSYHGDGDSQNTESSFKKKKGAKPVANYYDNCYNNTYNNQTYNNQTYNTTNNYYNSPN